jgi:hypothetical protein
VERNNNYKTKTKIMKSIFLLLISISLLTYANAQSPFKPLPKKSTIKYGGVVTSPTITSAFRFTGPIAGFAYPQKQVVTGLGYGWQKLHWVDSTQKYYADFSVSAVLYAGGNVEPSISDPNNILSVGISLGIVNQLIMAGPVYNFPKDGNKGSFGFVVNFSVPLNN